MGFLVDAGVTCKDSDRTCMPLHGWLRCCPTTGTATCGGEAIPTACVAFADGGSTGCDSIGASTTCCSETARPFCESLIMTTAGSTAHNIICAGRDRGTEWLPLLATATDDPRLSTSMTSPKSESNSVKTEFTNVPPVQTEINNSGDSDSEGSEESTVTVSVDEPDDSIGTETTTAGSDGNPEAAPATSSNEDKVPVGAIVGGVVGAIAIVSIALLVVWFFRRKQSRKDSNIGNDKSVTANLKGGISATQFRDTAIRKFRSPSSVFLQPQTLPDLPSSPPRGHIGGSRGGVSESKGGGSERPLSPPPPSERFYYGGVPKGVDDSWVGIPSSKPPPSSHPDSNGGFGSWRER